MADSPEIQRPNVVKRILCLANSRKLSGRCIAGREIVNSHRGVWIRPVSGREHQEVSWRERHYEDGTDPSVGDVVDVPLVESRPHLYQQENWLLDPNFYWRKIGSCNWEELQAFVDTPQPLWINGQSSFSGANNRVALVQAEQLRDSLRLIRVDALTIEVLRPGEIFGDRKRRVQARFNYARIPYSLRVTDPVHEQRYLAQPDGCYLLGESCLTISLGEPFEGFAYKLQGRRI